MLKVRKSRITTLIGQGLNKKKLQSEEEEGEIRRACLLFQSMHGALSAEGTSHSQSPRRRGINQRKMVLDLL